MSIAHRRIKFEIMSKNSMSQNFHQKIKHSFAIFLELITIVQETNRCLRKQLNHKNALYNILYILNNDLKYVLLLSC